MLKLLTVVLIATELAFDGGVPLYRFLAESLPCRILMLQVFVPFFPRLEFLSVQVSP